MAENGNPPMNAGWEVVRKIGTGSFGSVYEIQRNNFGYIEKAALKVIRIPQDPSDIDELYASGYDSNSITEHFKSYLAGISREYSIMAEMKGNTNIVYCDEIRFIQHDDGIGWDIQIRMELLTPMMKRLGTEVSEGEVIRLGTDLCKALALCAKKKIVHRDIKPQNIFVSDNGDYKLGDFGVAKAVERTMGGTKIGTYNYMAPEVYNNRPYGSAADIYSLGLVMYWMLNEKRLPFFPLPPAVPTNDEMDRARFLRFSGQPIPPPRHGSEELRRIVLKACAYDTNDRYHSAEEMLAELRVLSAERENVYRNEVPPYGGNGFAGYTPPIPNLGGGDFRGGSAPAAGQAGQNNSYRENGKSGSKQLLPFLLAATVLLLAVIAVAAVRGRKDEPEPTPTPQPVSTTQPSAAPPPTAAPTPTPTPLPTEGMGTDGNRLSDIRYHADGRIASLVEEGVEWEYVYSKTGEFQYRVMCSRDVPSLNSSAGQAIPGTDITYKILACPVENCVGFSFDYRVNSFSNGSMNGDRWVYAASDYRNGQTWQCVGNFEYDVYTVDMQWHEVTVRFNTPQTLSAFGTPRVNSDNYSIFDNEHILKAVWIADEHYVRLQDGA